jgi:uncharacterized protein (TIGR03083 family)
MERNDFGYVDTILEHSTALAKAAEVDLTARVEHCPEWHVADLVWHVIGVHWFWATIVEERLAAPVEEDRRPPRPADHALIETFLAGADHLATVLRRTPYRDRVWTWAPAQQDVGFVARHQVQEAAVHHFDAANATGQPFTIEPAVAADAIDEFLNLSVPNDADDLSEESFPALDTTFAIVCTDTGDAWTLTGGQQVGAIRATEGQADGVPVVRATAEDLLLWLYQRRSVDTTELADDVVERFTRICASG